MANAFKTTDLILKEFLYQLKNKLILGGLVNTQFKNEYAKVGETINVRRPVRFTAEDGPTLSNQDIEEGTVAVTINYDKHVSFKIPTRDLTLSIEDIGNRYISSAASAMAQAVETSIAGLYAGVWNFSGTPGTTPTAFTDLTAAALQLDNGAVEDDNRCAVFNPEGGWAMANGLKGVYINDTAKKAIERGRLGMYGGFNTYKCQSIKSHTVGVATGTPLVNGASQNVTYATSKDTNTQSLITDGWTADTTGILKAGDVITIAGVYGINPETKDSTNSLQHFVVTADANSGATTGPATLTIAPAIITSGAYQTVTAAPADNAAITVVTGTGGTAYPQNLAFHKDAFTLVTVPLEKPESATGSTIVDSGYSLLLTKDYDITNRQEIYRIDMIWGVKAVRPDMAARITG